MYTWKVNKIGQYDCGSKSAEYSWSSEVLSALNGYS